MIKIKSLSDYRRMIVWLWDQGCDPSFYQRGAVVRFHVNRAGNFWADANDLLAACEEAVNSWIEHGKPSEGGPVN